MPHPLLRLPRHALPLISAALLAGPALAADPVLGQSKFSNNCASCHSVASTSVVDRGRNNPAMIQAAMNNVPQMGAALSGRVSATDLADIAAYLGNSPSALSFSTTTVGRSSAVSTVTVSASRLAALSGLSSSVSGDFVLQGGSCGSSLAAGTSCTVGVVFRPTAAGNRSGSLTLNHSGISTPITIALSGSASAALQAGLSADSSSLAFGVQTVGSSSAARTVTLNNNGTASLDFSSIALSGSNAADFSRAGSCAVGTPLAVGASCTITATFIPQAAGSRSAAIDVAASAPAANGSVNLSIGLSGTGQTAAAPVLSLSASQLDFGSVSVGSSSSAQRLTVTNSGSAALSFSAISASGPFSLSHNCSSGVPAAGSCAIDVRFTPTGAGTASGSLSLSSNASSSAQVLALSGVGVLTSTAVLTWSPAIGADFGTVTVGADGGLKRFTLSNTGSAAATLSSFSLAGDAAADYRVDASSSCSAGATLSAGSSCELAVGFSPRAVGARAATANVVAANATLPNALALSGTGQGAPQPVLQLSSSTLDFSSGDTTGRTLTLSNSGNAALRIDSATLSSSRFSLGTAASQACGSAPFSLAAGASCQLLLTWQGAGASSSGADSATLTLQGNLTPASVSVSLSGSAATTAATSPSNSGSGGCTIAAGSTALDPLLALMAAASALILWRRRRVQDSH